MTGKMTTRIKSVLLIVATLIIGGVIGALIHARMTDQRFDRLAALRSHRGFVRLIERSIDFESPEQHEAVMDIIDQTAGRLFENMRRNRRETEAILDSTREQLREVLSEEQMEQLEKRLLRHRRERMWDGRPDRMPPGEGRRDHRPPDHRPPPPNNP